MGLFLRKKNIIAKTASQENLSLDLFCEGSFPKVALYLVPEVATCNCWIRYKNGYAGLLVLQLLPLLSPWLIVEMEPA